MTDRDLENKLLSAQLAIGKESHIKEAFKRGILSEEDRQELVKMFERKEYWQSVKTFRGVDTFKKK